mgnify:CR=1 FL=1
MYVPKDAYDYENEINSLNQEKIFLSKEIKNYEEYNLYLQHRHRNRKLLREIEHPESLAPPLYLTK